MRPDGSFSAALLGAAGIANVGAVLAGVLLKRPASATTEDAGATELVGV